MTLSAGIWVHLLVLNIVATDTFSMAQLGKTVKKAKDLWTRVAETHSWRQQGSERRVYRKAGIWWAVDSDVDKPAMFIIYY